MAGFVLTVADGATAVSWRWVLVEADSGRPVVDFEARLDTGAFEYAGFEDLYRFVRWNADPQNRPTSEAALVSQVGAWVGQHVLGGDLGEWLVDAAPVTVRVVLPPVLRFLVYRPLELAHVDGQALAAQDVSFVYEFTDPTATGAGLGKAPVADAVRVLGVFSLPTGASVLGLRQERFALAQLVAELGRSGRAVELRVLQYGVTRQRLRDTARDGDGWDLIHLSGHGTAGGFALEGADGSTDLVDAAELVRLLRPARTRVKLAVVSACESGAASAAEAMRLLGLTEQAQKWDQTATDQTTQGATGAAVGVGSAPVGGVARELGLKLGCPVVAMRFPVGDAFAIAFGARFYASLLAQGQPVAAAASIALSDVTGTGGVGVPAVSLAVPAVFGAGAQDLRLRPPTRAVVLDTTRVTMQKFPPEADRFVGRTREMITCSQALAPRSGRAGVLVHGMAGAGKTAIAVETAYAHRDSFAALAYWEGPKTPDGVFRAMENLAAALDIQLGPGFAMADKVTTLARLQEFLPRLTQLLEENGVLLVLDNLEHLIDDRAVWRDPRWATLLTALTGHRGQSRVILTSRVVPTGLDPTRVAVVPVHALSLAESLLLARELPGLNTLLTGDPRAGQDVEASRALLRETLTVVQGHPKLLELAAAAATRGLLTAQVAAARTAASAGGPALEAFLSTGDTTLDPHAFGAQLTSWTTTASSALPPASQLLLEVVCFLEEPDRDSRVLDGNWADVWTRLHPDDEHAPDVDQTLRPLVDAALLDAQTVHPGGPDHPPLVSYRVHPGVADAVRAHAADGVQDAVDAEAAAYWAALANLALNQEGGEAGGLVVRAGLAAAPYLIRVRDWESASTLLENVRVRDSSPSTLRGVVPVLRHIAQTTGTPKDLGALGAALQFVDPAEAETTLRRALAAAEDAGDHRLASAAASHLVNVLRDRGRLREALNLAETQAEYTRLAGLGEPDQIADTAQRLQILGRLGKHRQVLDEVQALLPRLQALPTQRRGDETIEPWNVRETTLGIGRRAALSLGQWQTALDLNADILTSKRDRGAGTHEIAGTRFNDYGPLLRLGRWDDADTLLKACQEVFEDANDTAWLGRVLSSRAQVEARQGHRGQAVAFERTALRYKYAARDWDNVTTSHNNLAGYLRDTGAPPAQWVAHGVANALILFITQGPTADALYNLAIYLVDDPAQVQAALPASFADLAARVETIDGVHLTDLITTITGTLDATDLDDLLTHTLTAARELTPQITTDRQAGLTAWEPRIAAVVAAANGDTHAAQAIEPVLIRLAETEDWRALVDVLRRIIAGERGDDLTTGPDRIDTAIITRTLDALAGRIQLTATASDLTDQTEIPHGWEPVLATVVAAAQGDERAAAVLDPELTRLAEKSGWPAAVRVLRRIIAGDRGPDLTTALDRVDTAIITRTLDALSGRTQLTATPADLPIQGVIPRWWEPVIATVVAAANGDTHAAQAVEPVLTRLAETEDWRALVGILRRIIAGERDDDLTTGLDRVDTAIITRTLDALSGRTQLTATPADLPIQGVIPRWWEPVLAAVAAAARGDQKAAAALDLELTRLADQAGWGQVVAVLRRVIAGERDPNPLTTGLDPVDTAIITRALDALSGRVELTASPADLNSPVQVPAELEPLLVAVVAAARGDDDQARDVESVLTAWDGDPATASIAGALRRIIDGERDDDQLTTGLSPVEAAITTRTLDALADRLQLTPPTPADVADATEIPQWWEERIAAVVAAAHGDDQAPAVLEPELTRLADEAGWGQVVAVLRRILAGERDLDQLTAGLDPVDTAIVTRTLDALAGRIELTPTTDDLTDETEIPPWWEPRIAAVVAVAGGDAQAAAVLEPELTRLADQAGWGQVVAALRRIIAGERDPDPLTTGLDGVDTAIIARTLGALAGRVELTAAPIGADGEPPDTDADAEAEAEAEEMAQQLVSIVVAAARGDREARSTLEPVLTAWAEEAPTAALAGALRSLLDGERDPDQLTTGLDGFETAIISRTLDHLTGTTTDKDEDEDEDEDEEGVDDD